MANQFTKMKVLDSLQRVREPGSHKGPVRLQLVDVVIVQQKKLSDKMSWCHYPPRRGDDPSLYNSNDPGRPYRFAYRINVYEKVLN